MSSVSRRRYDSLKNKAEKWMQKSDALKERLTRVEDECNTLRMAYEKECENKSGENDETVRLLKEEVSKLRDRLSQLPELQDQIARLQRDMLLKDGKIQQLEDSKQDLKERYMELREEHREYKRWNRVEKSSS